MNKILLVEDDPMIAEIYQHKLESVGFEVINAKTGKEALKYAKEGIFDLMLLDMVIPEISGMDVLREMKKDGSYDKNLKIIIFSNLNEIETRQEALELGADGFISKMQYSPSELVEEIKRLLDQFKERDKNENRLADNNFSNKSKKSILFIEDEEIFLEMFGKKLEDDGYSVAIANNGSWGLQEAIEGNYDLIITDMVMPAMSGEEIIFKLKENEKTKNIPIIAISASISEEKIGQIRNLGVAEFFFKTQIVPSDLSRKVEELLNNKN